MRAAERAALDAHVGTTYLGRGARLLRRRDHEVTVRVLNVPAVRNVPRREASSLIEVTAERELEQDI